MRQRAAETEDIRKFNERNRAQADLALRSGLPPPVCLSEQLVERLNPGGRHVLTFSEGTNTARALLLGTTGQNAGRVVGPKFMRVNCYLKLLGDDEPYYTQLDLLLSEFESLPAHSQFVPPSPANADYRRPETRAGHSPPGKPGGFCPKGIRGASVKPRKDKVEAQERKNLTFAVETVQVHRVECVGCDIDEEAEDLSLSEFVNMLFQDGWRVGTAGKSRGPLCPPCVKANAALKEKGK